MSFTQEDRTIIEVRELLVKTRNKDAVVRALAARGTDPDEARDLVYSIHKANLWANRKSSLITVGISGTITAILSAVWVTTGRLFIIWLPLSAIALIVGIVKFLAASGYEVDAEN